MRKTGLGLLGIGILFIGCNLRAPIVAVGPLEVFIRQDLNLSGSVMGFLTTLPLLAFALFFIGTVVSTALGKSAFDVLWFIAFIRRRNIAAFWWRLRFVYWNASYWLRCCNW